MILIGAAMLGLAALWAGLGSVLRLESFLLHKEMLTAFVSNNRLLAAGCFALTYVVVVAFSLPFALPMTLIGGMLFGGVIGTLATATGATLGAVLLFLAARGLFHDYFSRQTHRWLGRLRQEFHADAASYLLLLRMTPVFPFTVVNLAAALLGTPFRTYVWTTFFGILPGTIAFTLTGAGLGSVLDGQAKTYRACLDSGHGDCRASLDISSLLSREVVLGLAAFGLVMVLSILAKRLIRRSPAGGQGAQDR